MMVSFCDVLWMFLLRNKEQNITKHFILYKNKRKGKQKSGNKF